MKQKPSTDTIISAAALMAAATVNRGAPVDDVLATYGEFIVGLTLAHGLDTPAKFNLQEAVSAE